MRNEDFVKKLNSLQFQIDNLDRPEVHVHAGVAVYNDAVIPVGTGAWQSLTFNQERWDDAGYHSVALNTERLTVPTGYGGWYNISGTVAFSASAAGAIRLLGIELNGTAVYLGVQRCSF